MEQCPRRSVPGRPLWEVWIADGLDDGRVGLVGKVHHCMVDGLAAVELAALLLDPTPEPLEAEPDSWEARRTPDGISLLLGGVVERLREAAELARLPVRIVQHPRRLFGLAGKGLQTVRAVSRSLEASTPEQWFQRSQLGWPPPRLGSTTAARPQAHQGPL